MIEHNLDVIKLADWVIDLGPDAGDGGRVVAMGRPEDVASVDASHTGRWLRTVLRPATRVQDPVSRERRRWRQRPLRPSRGERVRRVGARHPRRRS